MDSILTSVKKALGSTAEYDHFDPEIIMHINSVFSDLREIGVGPKEGFVIEDDTSVWTDFISDNNKLWFENVKSYMYLRVQLLFDPPTTGSVLASKERQAEKMEWRLNFAAEEIAQEEASQNGE